MREVRLTLTVAGVIMTMAKIRQLNRCPKIGQLRGEPFSYAVTHTGASLANSTHEPVIVVSGLPRSGTSLMMQMLQAGGLQLLSDQEREADEDNPLGYHEYERVKALKKGDYLWLPSARGRVVKIISALLQQLPPSESYRVIFMRRRMTEVLASQRKMLERRGEVGDSISDERLSALFEKHLNLVQDWLATQAHFAVLYMDYNSMLAAPDPALDAVEMFLGRSLNRQAMSAIIDPSLYRNRA
jgi:hypothetical protein